MVDRFHPRLAVACSFQKEASVVLDLLLKIAPDAHVFTLDTHVLFPETYATWRQVEERYGITVEVHQGPSLDRQAVAARRPAVGARPGRLLRPAQGAAARARRSPTSTPGSPASAASRAPSRAKTPKLAWDARHERWKANPLADWTEADVWRYITEHDLPYNPLHDQGYASIGCTHCTRPGAGRDGRWAGTGKTECGLHG